VRRQRQGEPDACSRDEPGRPYGVSETKKCPDDYRDGLPGGSLGPSSATGSRQLSVTRSESAPRPLRTGRRPLTRGFLERLPSATIPSTFPCGAASVLARTSHSPLRASVSSLSGRSPSSLAGLQFATRASLPPSRVSGIPATRKFPFSVSYVPLSDRFTVSTGPRSPPFWPGKSSGQGESNRMPPQKATSDGPQAELSRNPIFNSLIWNDLRAHFFWRSSSVNTEPPPPVPEARRASTTARSSGFVGDRWAGYRGDSTHERHHSRRGSDAPSSIRPPEERTP